MHIPTAIPIDKIHFLLLNSGHIQIPYNGQALCTKKNNIFLIKERPITDTGSRFLVCVPAELRNSLLAHVISFASQPCWEYTYAVGFWQ